MASVPHSGVNMASTSSERPRFTLAQLKAILDKDGNVRCPYCGKYRKLEDFQEQLGCVFVGVHTPLMIVPACNECLDKFDKESDNV